MDKLNHILTVYIIPLFLAALGLVAMLFSLNDNHINIDQTTEISGTLNSYYTYKWGRGKSDYFIILKLNEYTNEFEDSYLTESLCKEYLINNKSKLTFRIDKKDEHSINGQTPIATIGTIVDGLVLQSAEQNRNRDKIINYLLPFLGLILVTLAYHSYRKGHHNHLKTR